MGWWPANEKGGIAFPGDTSSGSWGDEPADILGEAVDHIAAAFEGGLGRFPTKDEIRRGLEFHLGGIDGEEVRGDRGV